MGANKALARIPLVKLSLKTGNCFYKTCNIYVLFTQRSFDISRQNLHICNFAVIHYQLFWPNCCKTSTLVDIKAITCDNACRGHYEIQDSRFKIFIGITGQQVSFTNRQDNTQNINTEKKTHKSISNGRNICTNTIKGTSINRLYP